MTTRDKKNVCMCACVKEKQGTKAKTQKRGECDSEREMGRMAMTTRDKKSVSVCVKEKQGTKTWTQNRRECESERRSVFFEPKEKGGKS